MKAISVYAAWYEDLSNWVSEQLGSNEGTLRLFGCVVGLLVALLLLLALGSAIGDAVRSGGSGSKKE